MDLKEIFVEKTRYKGSFSFAVALAHLNVEFIGRPHSGIDDARMTALLAYELYKNGAYFHITKDINRSKYNRPL